MLDFFWNVLIFFSFPQTEFKDLVDKKHAKPIFNLQPALDLIADWQSELSQNTKENTELFDYWKSEMSKLHRNLSYVMQFPERILNVICQSKVFMYPDLLPPVPYRLKSPKSSEYFPAEDLWVLIFKKIFMQFMNLNVIYFLHFQPDRISFGAFF